MKVLVQRASFCLAFCFSLLGTASIAGQTAPDLPEVPPHFKLDMETAARLRPELMARSIPPAGRYETARLVFQRLIEQIPAASQAKSGWQLRMVEDDQLNAYSSPDGSVYVETGLAKLADQSAGLWAAILSHEIAHVMHRDWARRYLYENLQENGRGAGIVLGDPGVPSESWSDSEKASADLAHFCRQMELEADREGLMLMARAGYHPDFVPALHHLLHAHASGPENASIYAMHPCWEERDHDLSRAYMEASIEFEHRWPEWYATPGGNPPVVVFAEAPTARKTSAREWQVQIPMRCQNLAGAVEVVLRADPGEHGNGHLERLPEELGNAPELRQVTGCTSPKTTVVFKLENTAPADTKWTDVYVVDAWGAVLARTDFPKLPH